MLYHITSFNYSLNYVINKGKLPDVIASRTSQNWIALLRSNDTLHDLEESPPCSQLPKVLPFDFTRRDTRSKPFISHVSWQAIAFASHSALRLCSWEQLSHENRKSWNTSGSCRSFIKVFFCVRNIHRTCTVIITYCFKILHWFILPPLRYLEMDYYLYGFIICLSLKIGLLFLIALYCVVLLIFKISSLSLSLFYSYYSFYTTRSSNSFEIYN